MSDDGKRTPSGNIGVHTSHCCKKHGCCYGYAGEKCPVEAGTHPMDNALQCEICYETMVELRDSVALVPSTITYVTTHPRFESWYVMMPKMNEQEIHFFRDDRAGKARVPEGIMTDEQLAWIADKAKLMKIEGDQR